MNYKIFLRVDTNLTASSAILSWFEQINQPPLLDKKILWQCQTLLIEGFTNVVEHAHKNLPIETPIEIEAVRLENSIEICIWAYGEAFDLKQKLQEIGQLEANEEERGRGLKIMALLADELRYEPTIDNRYCLFIRKYY
ncbi:ATP-binding protein [Scytonema sp. NUACC26]|uniref:ATP-binding protein n=1 Tax=Scytonema sp. NUACC26 TaxID=3140176 RepID=UPI0034DC0081